MRSPRRWAADAELAELLTDVRILVVDTGRVWWRLLPQLLGLYLLGWLGSELALRLAVIAGDVSAWLALGLFALNFVSLLVAVVLILRLVGLELGIAALIPGEDSVGDGRDESVSRLLAVTLLPFIGLYAAFGQVNEAANSLVTEQFVRYGISDAPTVLGVLNDAALNQPGRLLAIVAGVYVLRRVLDLLHERTGLRPLGLVVAFVESFFLLVVILGGIRLVQRLMIWVEDRAVVGWVASVRDAAAEALARLGMDLPAFLGAAATLLAEQVWPVLWEVVTQPIIWLAVAALIYGSQVLSLAEVWRRGTTLASRVPGARRLVRARPAAPAVEAVPAPERTGGGRPPRWRRVAVEAQEAFFGDVNDKYLPTLASLRLVLRAGLVFLGSFVLVYAILTSVTAYATDLLYRLLGGHAVDFWLVWGPWVDLAQALPFEPLRLCLLAVAFRRCLELFRQRSLAAPSLAAVSPASLGLPTPAPGASDVALPQRAGG